MYLKYQGMRGSGIWLSWSEVNVVFSTKGCLNG
jgi:hypothetical protein